MQHCYHCYTSMISFDIWICFASLTFVICALDRLTVKGYCVKSRDGVFSWHNIYIWNMSENWAYNWSSELTNHETQEVINAIIHPSFFFPHIEFFFFPLFHRPNCRLIIFPFFYHQVPFADVAQKTLVMAVYDFDRFGKHDQIGFIKIPLNSVDLCKTLEEWRDINPPDTDADKVNCDWCDDPDSLLLL